MIFREIIVDIKSRYFYVHSLLIIQECSTTCDEQPNDEDSPKISVELGVQAEFQKS